MKRLLARAALTLVATAALVISGQPAATAAPHAGQSWTWDGPVAWTATYGTYGLTVSGNGGAVFDLGFATAICSPGATWPRSAAVYFKARRDQLKAGGWRFTAGPISRPPGFSTTYRRQVLEATYDRGRYTGQLILDYDFLTSTGGTSYCYQRSVAKYATTASWETKRTQLDAVQGSLDYTGAGAPAGQDPAKF